MPRIIEGARRAQQISSDKKIERLAEVVANGIWNRTPEDEFHEMMRIVPEVGELDILLLDILYKKRLEVGVAASPSDAVVPTYLAQTGVVKNDDVANSSLLKLQSFGLAIGSGSSFRILSQGIVFLELTGIVPPRLP